MLEVGRGDVPHIAAELVDGLAHFGGETDGREYGEGTGGELDYAIRKEG